MLQPRDIKDLCEVLSASQSAFAVEGTGTKRGLGRPTEHLPKLSLAAFKGIHYYDAAELALEAGAATPLDEIEQLLAKHNQMLAFEPPDYGRLFGTARGSIGSALVCNLSGPRRLTAGAARDHILGIAGVSGSGEDFKGGGRVVKNVTGYDMPRLMAGSFGTLAALTSVTFKVLPKPEAEKTLVVPCSNVIEAGHIMRNAMQAPCDVSAAAFRHDLGVLLRLEGIAASVNERETRLRAVVNSPASLAENSSAAWRAVRDVDGLANVDDLIWKISVAPSEGPVLAQQLARRGAKTLLDWSGGLVWAAMPDLIDARALMTSGHAMLFRAGHEQRANTDVFHPLSTDVAALSERLKTSLDPKGILNPHRMHKAF
jgi:glycolate oxidase FAD binding subunit